MTPASVANMHCDLFKHKYGKRGKKERKHQTSLYLSIAVSLLIIYINIYIAYFNTLKWLLRVTTKSGEKKKKLKIIYSKHILRREVYVNKIEMHFSKWIVQYCYNNMAEKINYLHISMPANKLNAITHTWQLAKIYWITDGKFN